MSKIIKLYLLVFLPVFLVVSAFGVEHIVWQQTPIKITLPIGKERLISFPGKIQFGLNRSVLPASVLRVQNDNHTLYLLAHRAFPSTRVEVKLQKTGQVILMDLTAQAQAPDVPLSIVLPVDRASGSVQGSAANVNYVMLTRFAVQQLYAPERLLKQSANIVRFPMDTTHIVSLFYDNSALVMPLASWRAGDWFVTALQVSNKLSVPLKLDPRRLCGAWQAATFYPREVLAKHGQSLGLGSTTLFLVSRRSFSQAVSAC